MKRTLLIEDNPECRKMLTYIIRYLGYDVIGADTNDGISKAVLDCPDLILLSLDFPEMRGLDVVASLKNNPATSSLPILVYPPWDSEEATEAVLEAGATEVLKEPFTLESFRQSLEKYASSINKFTPATHAVH